jgi:hypothetical protein
MTTTTNDIPLAELEQKQQVLANHPVFSAIQTMDDLRLFMSWHVFAVWDFMSLLKRLQKELTTIDLPWLPPANPVAARLINEIVLGEECDDIPGGGHLSHYEMYLLAMAEVGADTTRIKQFESALRSGTSFEEGLSQVAVPAHVSDFVKSTLTTAIQGSIFEVLGSFFFGRENVIPKMFKRLLDKWQVDEKDAPMFVYYLNRHIELDSDSHGPAAWKLITELTRDNPEGIQQLVSAARAAIDARCQLWDGLAEEIARKHELAA